VAESVVDEADSSRGGFNSIGVLPFVNMSDDPAQEYFSDGISEELLNALAKLKDLQVAARTSSFAFKGRNQPVRDIGAQLNVDTVLEGSVRKAGNKIRITAQLIEVENGYHLWSETYDRELTDIFAVQDEITAAIVAALLPHLNTGEDAEIIKAEATNMSAYDAYLQGRHRINSLEPDSARKALQSFRAATDADPGFAAAWAARATTVIAMRENAFSEGIPREESVLLASNAIERALAIDPSLPEAYVAQATLHADSYDFDLALESLSKALEINPSLVEALRLHARILSRFGRIKEAQRDILKALRLDPHNRITAILAANLATEFFEPEFFATVERSTVQFERAREIMQQQRLFMDREAMLRAFREAADGDETASPSITRARYGLLKELDRERIFTAGRVDGMVLMWVLIASDRWDSLREAHGDEVRVYGEISPNAPRSNSNLALNRVHCLRQLGRADEADEILNRVRTYVETLRQNTVYGFFMIEAKLLVLESDASGALDVLEAAHERDEVSWLSRYDPVVRTLADEPRFQALFQRIDDEIDAMRAELGMPPAAL
jgi:TolB-like protein